MTTGDYFFVDSGKSTGGAGKSWSDAFSDLDDAFSAVGDGDVIYMAPGTYTGNYTTEDDTVARNVAVIGVGPSMPGIRGGVNLTHSEEDEPVITAKASGWKFSNLCLRPGDSSSGIKLYADITTQNYIDGVAGGIAQGVTVDNCTFWGGGTGKYGVEFQGDSGVNSPHFCKIINNHFIYLAATGGAGIFANSDSNPIIGTHIIGNFFADCRNDVDTYADIGYVGSLIKGNTFSVGGVYYMKREIFNDSLLNIMATATPNSTGGNMIVENYFGCTVSHYGDDSSTDWVRCNGYDQGMGNWCEDGIPNTNISGSRVHL